MCEEMLESHASVGMSRLSPRERDVLALIAEGKTNKAIALALGLRPSTVRGYVESSLLKLDVENRTQAAAVWGTCTKMRSDDGGRRSGLWRECRRGMVCGNHPSIQLSKGREMSLLTTMAAGTAAVAVAGAATVATVAVLRTSGPTAPHPGAEPQASTAVPAQSLDPNVLDLVVTVSGDPVRRGSFHGGSPGSAAYGSPAGIAVARDGTIYVADSSNHLIIRIDDKGFAQHFSGSGREGVRDGSSTDAEFVGPQALAFGPDGSLYVADGYGNRVRKVDRVGNVSTLAGGGPFGLGTGSFRDGVGADARFDGVVSVAVEPDGSVLVADYTNQRIRKVSPLGVVSTIAGDGSIGRRDGLSAQSTFNFPSAISLAPDGSIFIAEHGNNGLRKLGIDGIVTTIIASGPPLAAGGLLSYPSGISIATDGTIFLADTQSNRILRFSVTGALLGSFGAQSAGFLDGIATQARFDFPCGLATLPSGELLVADKGNATIRKVTRR